MVAEPNTSTRMTNWQRYAQRAELLSQHTTMRVGGPAQWWAEPQSEEELVTVLEGTLHDKVPLRVLGNGSNLVASDDGFDGAILKLGPRFAWHRVEGHRLITGGATLLPRLTKFALQNSLGNFEWACGIPGSVGASIWGNAGARGFNGQSFEGRESASDIESLVAYDRSGERHELNRDEIEFSYRKSSLGELIVTEATFALKPLNEDEAKTHRQAVKDLLKKRRDTQPVNAASAGCIWKNPKVESCAGAGELIERLGLKGHSVGGAQVSEVHANFIVNSGEATGADVRNLMQDVEQRVLKTSGIRLEREVRLLGD
jgi:UDP-N-acetylmuramate dehydrogenase